MSAIAAFTRSDVDVLWFPSLLGFVPVLRRTPILVGIHDAIGHRYPASAFGSRFAARAWRAKTSLAVAQAASIVTVSQHARSSLIAHLGLRPERIRVVSEAPAAVFAVTNDRSRVAAALAQLHLSNTRLVVYHGSFAPHKNLLRLVDAFRLLTDDARHHDVRLLLIEGSAASGQPSDRRALKSMAQGELGGRVVLADRLPDSVLAALLNGARVAVLPSLDEGLGLTALEAAACGAVVAATTQSAMPELLGDACLTFEPTDVHAIHVSLARLLDDEALRLDLRTRALERVSTLTWQRAAQQMPEVIAESPSSLSRQTQAA